MTVDDSIQYGVNGFIKVIFEFLEGFSFKLVAQFKKTQLFQFLKNCLCTKDKILGNKRFALKNLEGSNISLRAVILKQNVTRVNEYLMLSIGY